MIGYCETCGTDTEQVIIQSRRDKKTRAYCMKCKTLLREENKADKAILRHYRRSK